MSDDVEAGFEVVMTSPPPVSVNKLYANGHHGRRFLTKAGAAYKDALKTVILRKVMVLPWKDYTDLVYAHGWGVRIEIDLFFADAYNSSWTRGATTYTEGGQPRSPFRKKDGANYEKVISDAVTTATGIDDSAHRETVIRVHHASEPATKVRYQIREDLGR